MSRNRPDGQIVRLEALCWLAARPSKRDKSRVKTAAVISENFDLSTTPMANSIFSNGNQSGSHNAGFSPSTGNQSLVSSDTLVAFVPSPGYVPVAERVASGALTVSQGVGALQLGVAAALSVPFFFLLPQGAAGESHFWESLKYQGFDGFF